MNYRWYEVLAPESIATAGTKQIDLKGQDPISALMVVLRLTGATGTVNNPPDRAITRVRLVDGSEVLCNGKGISFVPLHLNTFGSLPMNGSVYLDGVQSTISYTIPFGRGLFDPQYGIDSSRYKNLKLEIEHAYTNGGLGTPSAATMQVYALMYDQKIPNLKGYINWKEVYQYTLTDSSVKYIELPVDLPIRTIAIQSSAKGYSINSQYGSIKLREDSDKHVIFDESTSNLAKIVYPQPSFVERIYGYTNGTTQRLHYGYAAYESHDVPTASETDDSCYTTPAYGSNMDVRSGTGINFVALRYGQCANGLLWLPLGNQQDPTDWYRPNRDTDLELVITAGSSVLSSSTLEVLLQQEVLY